MFTPKESSLNSIVNCSTGFSKNLTGAFVLRISVFLSGLEIAKNTSITADRRNRNIEVKAPYVAEMVRKTIYDQFGEETYSRGIEVTTSIRLSLISTGTSSGQRVLPTIMTYIRPRPINVPHAVH